MSHHDDEQRVKNRVDILSFCLVGASVIMSFSIIFVSFASVLYQQIVAGISTVLLAVAVIRMLRLGKKNYELRNEAQDAVAVPEPEIDVISLIGARCKGAYLNIFHGDREYKYFVCPCCKQTLRIPRNKGAVRICCAKCKSKFDGNT